MELEERLKKMNNDKSLHLGYSPAVPVISLVMDKELMDVNGPFLPIRRAFDIHLTYPNLDTFLVLAGKVSQYLNRFQAMGTTGRRCFELFHHPVLKDPINGPDLTMFSKGGLNLRGKGVF